MKNKRIIINNYSHIRDWEAAHKVCRYIEEGKTWASLWWVQWRTISVYEKKNRNSETRVFTISTVGENDT